VPLDDAHALGSLHRLPELLGKSPEERDHLVQHAGTPPLREGRWKCILPGWDRKWNRNTNTELGNDLEGLMYGLDEDPGEQVNRFETLPERPADA
jgi:hypothetical protein